MENKFREYLNELNNNVPDASVKKFIQEVEKELMVIKRKLPKLLQLHQKDTNKTTSSSAITQLIKIRKDLSNINDSILY